MKTSLGNASIVALSLLSLSTPWPAAAQTSASASYWFVLEDDLPKVLELDAWADEKGTTTGQMTLTDPARIPDVDDPEDPGSADSPPEFYANAKFDSLVVEKNQALMRGTVVDSSHRTYLGKWVQLVVEDNGTNREVPDHLLWVFCNPRTAGWVPSDAERTDDDGAYLSWWATDAERDDDIGIPSPNLLPAEDLGCPIYSRSVYSSSFADVLKWDGDIIVKP